MKKTKRCFRRFDLSVGEDVREYEEILNDPLCKIVQKELLVEKRMIYDEEGKPSRRDDIPTYLVHWDEDHF